jgi:hypothetical protein
MVMPRRMRGEQLQRCETASLALRGTLVGRGPLHAGQVKTRSHRLIGIALRVVPLAALALLVEHGGVVLADGPRFF